MEGSAKDGAHAPFEVPNLSLKRVVRLTACVPTEACACSHMPVHCTIEAADYPAAEQLLLTIGRAGVLSCRAIAAEELETLLRLLGPPSERQRSNLRRGTDPGRGRHPDLLASYGRGVRRRCLCHGACASDAHLMSTATL